MIALNNIDDIQNMAVVESISHPLFRDYSKSFNLWLSFANIWDEEEVKYIKDYLTCDKNKPVFTEALFNNIVKAEIVNKFFKIKLDWVLTYLYARHSLHWNLSYGLDGITICAYETAYKSDIVYRKDFPYIIKFPKTAGTCLRILKDRTFECSDHKVYTIEYILKMFPIDYNDKLTDNEFNFFANDKVQEMFKHIIFCNDQSIEDKKYVHI